MLIWKKQLHDPFKISNFNRNNLINLLQLEALFNFMKYFISKFIKIPRLIIHRFVIQHHLKIHKIKKKRLLNMWKENPHLRTMMAYFLKIKMAKFILEEKVVVNKVSGTLSLVQSLPPSPMNHRPRRQK